MSPSPLQHLLACFERARVAILGEPYSTDASRRLEDIDAMADDVYAELDSETPRTYGDNT